MSATGNPGRQIAAIRGDGNASSPKDNLANEMLGHHRQRRRQKSLLFYSGLVACCLIFIFFCVALFFVDRTKELIEITPFALIPLSILGATPVLILVILFRCVFRPSGDNGLLDKKDIETVKEIVGLFRS